MRLKQLLIPYIILSIIYLILLLIEQESVSCFIKPFLILSLIVAVISSAPFSSKKILITALVCSSIGDIILLFSNRGEIYFLGGLIFFLISQIVYILLFNNQLKYKKSQNSAVFWLGVTGIIIYLFAMISILLPSLGSLTIPVFVYALVICTMLLFAFNGFLNWAAPARWYIFIGALSFVISDSLLAFDKFYATFYFSSFWIMASYLIAQFLIVVGILYLNKKK